MRGLQTVPQTVPHTPAPAPARGARKRKSKHRGVLLIPPAPPKNPHWRARFRDPETGRTRVVTLEPADAKTAETREAYALRTHKAISRRRDDIGAGASPHRAADLQLSAALDRYFESWGSLKSAQTVRVYRDACDLLVAWAGPAGVRTVRQLSKGRLRDFAASRAKAEKRTAKRGGKRGETKDAGRRSPHSVNRELRAVATVLNALRKMEVVRLSRDDIADGLERIAAPVERRDFLRAEQVRKLLAACREHDRQVFALTRDGATDRARFTPITPFVEFVLFTGMRSGEATAVLGSDVSVDENQFHVRAAVSKTKGARTLDLSVSSTLTERAPVLAQVDGPLFPLTQDELASVRKRLIREFGAPHFTWHALRRTCGTYLTCAPGIFDAASAYMSARQLGHSVTIAEKHYAGVVKVAPDARTLEQAMGL